MPKYRYTVINPQNKELTGTIVAGSEKDAREELNQLGFSVLTMDEIREETKTATTTKSLPKFEFGAIDKNQKHVAGTIEAEDRYSAYKRLVHEYLFEVEYLVESSLDENKKQAERQKGIYELQNRLDEDELNLKKKASGDNFDIKEFTEKQQALQIQIEFVLKKVKELLDLYEGQMKPEVKEKIRRYVDKILRLKSSTNLDYIRKNCEELLTFLQQEELFLSGESHQKERSKLTFEAKSMMMQLHHKKTDSGKDIFEQLRLWRQQHINENDQPTLVEYFINTFISLLIGFSGENDAIRSARENIKDLNHQLKQYVQLYFQLPNPEYKMEAKESLKNLWKERKKLIKKYKELKKSYKQELKNRQDHTPWENFSRELLTFSGWLLAFYLCYYFTSFYLTTKNFGLSNLPTSLSFYHSAFLKYFLAILFLFHSSLSIKINFFKRNETAAIVITPIFLIGTIFILLNF